MIRVFLAALLLFAVVLPTVANDKTVVSDDVLTDRVRQRLVSDPEVKGYLIDVKVKNAVVTLDGTVHNDKAKIRAEKITRKEKGVKDVVNNLHIEIAAPNR